MDELQSIALERNSTDLSGRVRGCLLAGAVGDALGAGVEFMSLAEITRQYGKQGIQDYTHCYGRIGAITDDTQMTLFTADGLLRGLVAGMETRAATTTSICDAYLRWLDTQGGRWNSFTKGWLDSIPELHASRAPGRTCIAALQSRRDASATPAQNDRKGCGTVMRVAPIGLFYATSPEEIDAAHVFQIGADSAALTHGHPTGFLSAGVMAVLIQQLILGQSLKDALAIAKAVLIKYPSHTETLEALENTEALALQKLAPAQAIMKLGGG